MVNFRILAERLPLKWQAELRQALAGSTVAPAVEGDKAVNPITAIDVSADGPEVVDLIAGWIHKTNRLHRSERTFAGHGISLRIEALDGRHIFLTERNSVVVKRFLMK